MIQKNPYFQCVLTLEPNKLEIIEMDAGLFRWKFSYADDLSECTISKCYSDPEMTLIQVVDRVCSFSLKLKQLGHTVIKCKIEVVNV